MPGAFVSLAALAVVTALSELEAQNPSPSLAGNSVPVTVDNFIRAETDKYFSVPIKKVGIGKFYHAREVAPVDKQLVVRGNLDTLYSTGVWDLDAGPLTVTLPNAASDP